MRKEIRVALIDCPNGHQFSNHASNNCPYCNHEKSADTKIDQNFHSSQASSKSVLPTFSRGSGKSKTAIASHRQNSFGTILKCLAVVIMIVIALMAGRRFIAHNPSIKPTTVATTNEPIVPVETCMKITSTELMDAPPNWSDQTTPCDQSDAFVKITKIQNSSESTEECENTEGCLWVSHGDFIYQYNLIPHIGQCFYGYINTAWPSKGKYGNGWPYRLTECGMSFPEWADKSIASSSTGVEETFLKPVQYRIEKIDVDDSACEQAYWEVVYSPGKVTTICASVTDSAH